MNRKIKVKKTLRLCLTALLLAFALPAYPAENVASPLRLTVLEAVRMAFEHNRAYAVKKTITAIKRENEEKALAAFDPVVSGSLSAGKKFTDVSTPSSKSSDTLDAEGKVTKKLEMGMVLEGSANASITDPGTSSVRLGAAVTAPLMQGKGEEANLYEVRLARLDADASEYEVRALAESTASSTIAAYWDYSLALMELKIVEESLALAQRGLDETNGRIEAGKLAESERVTAEAEVALRRQAVIDADSRLEKAGIDLLRLLNPPSENLFALKIAPAESKELPAPPLPPLEEGVRGALKLRPEANQARLDIRRGELSVAKTRNGLLPKLDLFIRLGKSGYADSFGQAAGEFFGESYDASAGVTFSFPLGNRAARASEKSALLEKGQAEEALGNLLQLIEADVRKAHIEARRQLDQIEATKASERLEAEKARSASERYEVGRATGYEVALARRDEMEAHLGTVRASAGYLKALAELQRLEGALLDAYGISAPGQAPVE
ncbi:TolC family protein [bacterium]|nr:MAG: TolC family protein [bacterium]